MASGLTWIFILGLGHLSKINPLYTETVAPEGDCPVGGNKTGFGQRRTHGPLAVGGIEDPDRVDRVLVEGLELTVVLDAVPTDEIELLEVPDSGAARQPERSLLGIPHPGAGVDVVDLQLPA